MMNSLSYLRNAVDVWPSLFGEILSDDVRKVRFVCFKRFPVILRKREKPFSCHLVSGGYYPLKRRLKNSNGVVSFAIYQTQSLSEVDYVDPLIPVHLMSDDAFDSD